MVANWLEQSFRKCEKRARASGSTFVLAFCSLPRDMARDMCALYAFMRQTDDIGDDTARPPAARLAELDSWESQLAAVLAGDMVSNPLLPAIADVAQRKEIPADELHEVIHGVRSDLQPREFQTFAELEHYCYQVAGVVGLSCLRVWGVRGDLPREAALACGTAFQLTNILRDLRADALEGRVYLPQDDLQAFQCDPEWLKQSHCDPRLKPLLRFEVQRAWQFYERALDVLDHLQPDGQRILGAFIELYASLLQEIEKRDFDVFSRRVSIPRWKKFRVLCRCLLRCPVDPRKVLEIASAGTRWDQVSSTDSGEPVG